MSNNDFNIEEYLKKIKIDAMDWFLAITAVFVAIIIMLTFVFRIDVIVSYGFSVLYIIVAAVIMFAFLKDQAKMIKALDEKHKKEGN